MLSPVSSIQATQFKRYPNSSVLQRRTPVHSNQSKYFSVQGGDLLEPVQIRERGFDVAVDEVGRIHLDVNILLPRQRVVLLADVAVGVCEESLATTKMCQNSLESLRQ